MSEGSNPPSFAELGLCAALCRVLDEFKMTVPTAVQQNLVPVLLNGSNAVACSPTGSGKTFAVALPMLQILSQDPYSVFCLVLSPTRELAVQLYEQIASVGEASVKARVQLIIGGVSITEQASAMTSNRPHIVVGTPGRIWEHVSTGSLKLNRVRFFALDEADRLLKPQFAGVIQKIANKMPSKRQTVLVSATMSDAMRNFFPASEHAFKYGFEASSDDAVPEKKDDSLVTGPSVSRASKDVIETVAALDQRFYFIPADMKPCYFLYVVRRLLELRGQDPRKLTQKKKKKKSKRTLDSLLKTSVPDDAASQLCLIFAGSCKNAELLYEMLTVLSVPCAVLHGKRPQSERMDALQDFRDGKVPFLIATDVASRGLDIARVDLVVNYDLPRSEVADYVHRVGRTARAGKAGMCINFVTTKDVKFVHAVEAVTARKWATCDDKESDPFPFTAAKEAIREHLGAAVRAWHKASLKLELDNWGANKSKNDAKKRKRNKI